MSGLVQAPEPTRPVCRYHGGKWRMAPWIIGHFPAHRRYVEPFGGAGSVLIRKQRSYAEVYNDLDEEIVSLFRVLRDRKDSARLKRLLRLTPYARVEFEESYEPTTDRVEQARRMLVRSYMAHGSSGMRRHRTGFRLGGLSVDNPASDWRGYPQAVPAIVERLQGVFIEKRPASRVIADHDAPDTLFYVDPPYPFATRSTKRIGNDLYHGYKHELSDNDHERLLLQLAAVEGLVVLSSYPNDAYDEALAGWRRLTFDARSDQNRPTTEVLYLNPRAAAALDRERLPLFGTIGSA